MDIGNPLFLFVANSLSLPPRRFLKELFPRFSPQASYELKCVGEVLASAFLIALSSLTLSATTFSTKVGWYAFDSAPLLQFL